MNKKIDSNKTHLDREEKKNEKVLEQIKTFFRNNKIDNITPIELSDSANMNVKIAPYPMVARISTFLSEQDINTALKSAQKEINVAYHLGKNNVPIIKPTNIIKPGPYCINGLCMTLWEYVSVAQKASLESVEVMNLLNQLCAALRLYDLPLEKLGVWKRLIDSSYRLRNTDDEQIKFLLKEYEKINEVFNTLPSEKFVPSHGDAHSGNLLYTNKGWIWTDFEDVCIMPKYWDFASYTANMVLFNGRSEPTYQCFINNNEIIDDIEFFYFMLKARMVFATLGNIDYALLGYGDSGDLWFAKKQLGLVNDYLT